MKKLVFTILIVIVLLAGCAPASTEPASSTPALPASQYPGQKEEGQQAVFYKNWEFTLNSFSIKSTDVNVNISVTSHFDAPREYDAYRIVLIDQYFASSGMIFGDTIDKEHFYGFYEGIYYPGDTKTGNLRFRVNPKSGKVSLHLYSPYMKSVMSKLFDLGEIK